MTDLVLDFAHCRRVSEYYRYQRYYVRGFKEHAGVGVSFVPRCAALYVSAREKGVRGIARLSDRLSLLLRAGGNITSDYAGRYTVAGNGRRARVAIDAHDAGAVVDTAACAWADLYFKANFWPGADYPEKVRPLVNGNGFLDAGKIAALKALRGAPRTRDLVCVSRVWAGSGERRWDSVEHQIRCFEALAALRCSKKLLAIFPREYRGHALAPYLERLARAGVPHLFGFYPYEELCRDLASAKVVFMRSGKHGCIPWRMIDLLCLGACVAFDSRPRPQWPEPLRPGVNFIDCGLSPDGHGGVREGAEYAGLPARIGAVLADGNLQERVRESNRDYFDRHANPAAVAGYVLAGAERLLQA